MAITRRGVDVPLRWMVFRSRASLGYDFPLPPGDDPPCHVVDGCPAGGCSYVSIMLHDRPAQDQNRGHLDGPVRRDELPGFVAIADSLGPATGPVFAGHPSARRRCERTFRFLVAIGIDV
jgi:hypothetical protein